MFAEEVRRAVMAAPRVALSDISRTVWGALAEGHLTEAEAENLSGLIETRRALPPARKASVGSRPRTPESIERRRRWAASGSMPVGLAARFSLAEQAALAIVADEVRRTGDCQLCIGAIAGKAGIGETSVRNAIREAKNLGLVTVEERRVATWRNLANVVRIVSPEWSQWLDRRGRGGACKSSKRTIPQIVIGKRETTKSGQNGYRGKREGEAERQDEPTLRFSGPPAPLKPWKRQM